MSSSPVEHPASSTASGYEDGFGRRVLAFNREDGGFLERLHFRPVFGAYEQAVRDAMSRVAGVEDARVAVPLAVERDEDTGELVLVSPFVAGDRLSDLIELAHEHGRDETVVPGLDVAIGFLTDILPILDVLRQQTTLAHGALSPSRIVLSPSGGLVLVEAGFSAVLQKMNLSRTRLWKEFRIAMPPAAGAARFDFVTDIGQAALCALTLALGRPLDQEDIPEALPELMGEAIEIAQIRSSMSFAVGLQRFLQRALPLPGRRPYPSLDAALADVRHLASIIGGDMCRTALADFTRQLNGLDAGEGSAAEPFLALEDIFERGAPAPRADETPLHRGTLVEAPAASEPAEEALKVAVSEPGPGPAPSLAEAAALPVAEPSIAVSFVAGPFVAETPAGEFPVAEPPDAECGMGERVVAELALTQPLVAPSRVADPGVADPPVAELAPTALVGTAPLLQPDASLPVEAEVESEPMKVSARRRRGDRNDADSLRSIVAPAAGPPALSSDPARLVAHATPAAAPPPPPALPTPAPLMVQAAETVAAFTPPPIPQPVFQSIPVQQTPPMPVWDAPPPAAPIAVRAPAARALVTPPSAPLRIKTEAPAGYTSRAPRYEPREFSAAYVDPRTDTAGSSRRRLPLKIAVAAAALMVTVILAGRVNLPELPDRTMTAEAKGAPVPAVSAPVPVTTGTLVVTSQPAGARVLLDGGAAGETPLRIENVAPGRHVLTLITAAATVRRTVRIDADKTVTVDVPVFSGWVAIFAPIVLEVSEEGRVLGTTEQPRLLLPPGRHTLTLSNRELGYSATHAVEIEAGEVTTLNIQPRGTVNLNAQPWAEVWIDGNKKGETPIANLQLPLGTRDIIFRHPQLGERRVTTTVRSGAPVAVSVDFTR